MERLERAWLGGCCRLQRAVVVAQTMVVAVEVGESKCVRDTF